MPFQVSLCIEALVASIATEGLFATVHSHVDFEDAFCGEALVAHLTAERFLSQVFFLVMSEVCLQSKLGEADLTLVILLASVSDLMLAQCVWCFESFGAQFAMVWPHRQARGR